MIFFFFISFFISFLSFAFLLFSSLAFLFVSSFLLLFLFLFFFFLFSFFFFFFLFSFLLKKAYAHDNDNGTHSEKEFQHLSRTWPYGNICQKPRPMDLIDGSMATIMSMLHSGMVHRNLSETWPYGQVWWVMMVLLASSAIVESVNRRQTKYPWRCPVWSAWFVVKTTTFDVFTRVWGG